MLGTLLAKVIGTQNERELKRLRPLVDQVNALEASIKPLSDEQQTMIRLAMAHVTWASHEVAEFVNALVDIVGKAGDEHRPRRTRLARLEPASRVVGADHRRPARLRRQ